MIKHFLIGCWLFLLSSATQAQYDTSRCFLDNNGLYGLTDSAGHVLLKGQFKYCFGFVDDVAVVTSAVNKRGLLHRNGYFIANMKFDGIGPMQEGFCQIINRGQAPFFLRRDGKELHFSFPVDRCSNVQEGSIVVRKNNKAGFADTTGRLFIPIQYDDASPFSAGIALVKRLNNRQEAYWGFIDRNGKELFPFIRCARIKGDGAVFIKNGSVEVWLKETASAPGDVYRINIKGERIQ